MDILTIFSSASPGILGLATLLVSWRQYATSNEQVRIELFDKRFKVYFAAKRFAATVVRENKVENDDFYEFRRDTSESTFLFPQGIQKLLRSIHEAANKKRTYRRKSDHMMNMSGPSEETSQIIDDEERETLKLQELLESLEEEFMPFLDFREFRINRTSAILPLACMRNLSFLTKYNRRQVDD